MVRWYPFLNNKKGDNLFDREKIEDDNIIICQQLESRKYARFSNYLSFKTYKESVNYYDDCFYEIITNKKFRNPYFDIDSEINPNIKENELILKLKKIIKDLVDDAIILIYSSHSKDKLSFHVVIPNYYFTNCDEGKNFYLKIIELIDEKYRSFIDNSVYKTIQQFRILGSHKYQKENKKIYREDLSEGLVIPEKYKKFPKGLENFLLINSLVSMTAGAKYLDGYEKVEEVKTFSTQGFSSTSDLEDILNIFYSIYSADLFEFLNVIDNDGNLLITFLRKSSSLCEECNRIHDNENPFVTVNGIYRNIYFYCRRREGDDRVGGKYIGSLGPEVIPELSVDDIPRIQNNFSDGEFDSEEEEEIELEGGTSIVDEMKKSHY